MHQLNNKLLNKIPLVPSSIIRPTLSYLPGWTLYMHVLGIQTVTHSNGV